MLGVRTRLTLIPGILSFPTCLKQVKLRSVEIRGKSHFLTPSISFQSKETGLHRGKTANKNHQILMSAECVWKYECAAGETFPDCCILL